MKQFATFNKLSWLFMLNQDKSIYYHQSGYLDNPESVYIRQNTEIMSFRIRLACSRPIKFLGSIAMKCWAFSGAYILACFFLYWLYGGILAFFLLCFATTGLYLSFCYRRFYFLRRLLLLFMLLFYWRTKLRFCHKY